ncbi:hypothetical protein AMTRI_Chr04g252610 [Amborella trichopoda]|uniref:non-specific serine/threonine protein kinase n=1 Tax=Amborella trichopoda TaxID=13333 RepID=W1NGQ1_AMBTC|nr:probable serine/threonine-protein kinase PBL3 [Amborella trichopoda]ERM94384.1 hypothetical protein AMTR_s00010p00251410 [Amborella trichopoda]|eukprot:XP_006827147.1 probable serine/threonine-protein kinase PBL3 [Amborella trichopoda]
MGNCFDKGGSAQTAHNSEISRPSNSSALTVPPSMQTSGSDSGKSNIENPPTPRTEGEILSSPNLKAFTFNELKNATRNFRPDSLIGEGGFGYVFKGWIDQQSLSASKPGSGMVVAVKKLKPEGYQGHKEWLAEVNYLGQLHHPNLVKLIGYCLEGDNRLLVYEFMPKGSLENHLFRRGPQPLSWAIRIKVAVGAARGLAFLHNSPTQVIYRDFKASNILLDTDFNSKLSDFGLAKDGPTGDNTHVSTQVVGTYGYAAPEYVATGRLTTRSDVYSFGVVLLELLTGRRALDKLKPGIEQNLVDWAGPQLNDRRKIFRIMDTRLEGQYSQKGALAAATLALRCLNSDAKSRPLMAEVLDTLEQIQQSSSKDSSKPKQPSNHHGQRTRNPHPPSPSPRRSPLPAHRLPTRVG